MLFLSPAPPGEEKSSIPNVFGVEAPTGDSEEAERTAEEASEKRAESGEPRPVPPKPEPEEPPPEAPEPPVLPPEFVKLTRPEFKSADIAGMGTAPRAAPAGETAAADAGGSGARPGDSAVIGRAPNGEPLYAARWYREPTNAELAPYISRRASGPGWGMIACRMVAGYRVEDCQEIGEGPRGSGYGGSVRQAAWQFRVRPPRVGGAEKFGTWVQIRITYDREEAE